MGFNQQIEDLTYKYTFFISKMMEIVDFRFRWVGYVGKNRFGNHSDRAVHVPLNQSIEARVMFCVLVCGS